MHEAQHRGTDCHSQFANWLRNDTFFTWGCSGFRRRGAVTPPYGRAAEYAAGGTMWASSPTECNKKCGGWVVGDADPYGCAARSAAVYADGQRRPPLHRAGKLVWAAGHMGPALQGLYALTAGGVEPRPYGAVNDRIS